MKITKNAKKVTASTRAVKPQKKVNSTTNYDKAQQHIKAAIDVLANSDDEITKDIIANLSVCLFDIKASTSVKASIELTDEQKAKVDEIADKYVTSKPVSGDWDTETTAEQKEISKTLGVSSDEAKKIMIDYLGFEEDMFEK